MAAWLPISIWSRGGQATLREWIMAARPDYRLQVMLMAEQQCATILKSARTGHDGSTTAPVLAFAALRSLRMSRNVKPMLTTIPASA
jgi:hypothetical protein